MKSISSRIYKGIFLVCLICILILVVTVLVANEALETTMLRAVPDDVPVLELSAAQKTEPFVWDGATNKIAFIPNDASTPDNLPAPFTQLTGQTDAEIELGGETFLVNVQHSADGTLYWARNISAFEARENHLIVSLFLIVGAIVAFSLVLAIASSRNIVRPLQQLSRQIGALPIGKEIPAIGVDYHDQELHDIAVTFNHFVDELNAYVEREQRLLNLASHELRTPIAVAAGALDVIESRGQLAANDKITLRRIRMANDEMAENVQILLKLARTGVQLDDMVSIHVHDCVTGILRDLQATFDVTRRVHVEASDVRVMAPLTMLRMLLRNLIQNALQHTTGIITIDIRPSDIIIRDQGLGRIMLPDRTVYRGDSETRRRHDGVDSIGPADKPDAGGLGLYIVSLICEQLGWPLKVSSYEGPGNSVCIVYGSPDSLS